MNENVNTELHVGYLESEAIFYNHFVPRRYL